MISFFQKIDFFLQLAGYLLDERVGGDLGIMAYHGGQMPCEKWGLFGRARDVNRGDIRAVGAAGDPLHELSFDLVRWQLLSIQRVHRLPPLLPGVLRDVPDYVHAVLCRTRSELTRPRRLPSDPVPARTSTPPTGEPRFAALQRGTASPFKLLKAVRRRS